MTKIPCNLGEIDFSRMLNKNHVCHHQLRSAGPLNRMIVRRHIYVKPDQRICAPGLKKHQERDFGRRAQDYRFNKE